MRNSFDSSMCLVGHASDTCCILLFKFAYLISSSNWQCFRIKALSVRYHTENTRKVMGKILVAGKRLNLGVRGPGEKPSWRETRSSGTGGGEALIPQSLGTKGNQEG